MLPKEVCKLQRILTPIHIQKLLYKHILKTYYARYLLKKFFLNIVSYERVFVSEITSLDTIMLLIPPIGEFGGYSEYYTQRFSCYKYDGVHVSAF